MLRHIRLLPEEVLFFGRLSLYGLVVGTTYWFLTYETIGSILLIGLGGAMGVLTLVLAWRRRRDVTPASAADASALEGPFADPGGRLPTATFAPLEIGLGIAVASLSFAFGAWLALAAVVPLIGGFLGWLRAAEAEYRAVEADDAAAAAEAERQPA